MKSFPPALYHQRVAKNKPVKKGCKFLAIHLWNDRGSATIEFVTLSIPLLIPFALYLTVVNSNAQLSYEAHTLARQLARVYVTSPSEELGAQRISMVMNSHIFPRNMSATYRILCSHLPCLTSGAPVTIQVTLRRGTDQVVAQDSQIVDSWRNT